MRRADWSRRALLGSGLAAALVPRLARAGSRPVVVLGAGIAGLNAALTLHDAGIASVVLEGSGRVGGRVFSTTGELGEGLVLERGGAFIDSDHHDVLRLTSRFDLPLFDREADERAHPETPVAAFQFDGRVLSEAEVADRLRPLARRLRRDARRLNRRYDRVIAELDGVSARDYLDDVASEQGIDPVAREICDAIVRSDYGAEPSDSSAIQLLYSLPRVRRDRVDVLSQADEVFSVAGGNQRLVDAMAASLPAGTIRRHHRVVAIRERAEGGFVVATQNGATVVGAEVICTIPFTVLRGIELGFRDPVPEQLLGAVATYQLGLNEKVVLGVDQRVWQSPRGFRGELWTERGLVWEASRTQPDHPRAALTIYLGGSQVEALQGPLDPRTFAARIAPTVPGLGEALTGEAVVTRWRDNPFTLGAYTTFPAGLVSTGPFVGWLETGEAHEVGCRGFLVAGEHVSESDYGYVNGGAETGRRAAEAIIARRRPDA